MMLSNCSTSVRRPSTLTDSWKLWVSGAGGWPIWPAATWTFCSRMAARTSSVVMPSVFSFWGSSQIRML